MLRFDGRAGGEREAVREAGCGGKQAAAGPLDPELKSKASAAALAEYRKNNPAEKDVEARVTDYGCHIQVDIEKGGRTIWSYSYQDGNVIDNSCAAQVESVPINQRRRT